MEMPDRLCGSPEDIPARKVKVSCLLPWAWPQGCSRPCGEGNKDESREPREKEGGALPEFPVPFPFLGLGLPEPGHSFGLPGSL